jgi:hypothetical protein
MNNFIFQPKQQCDNPLVENYFTLMGSQDFLDDEANPRVTHDSPKAYAKIVSNAEENTTKFFIKTDHYAKLLNPMSIYEDDKNKFMNQLGRQIRFKTVNQKVFDLYLTFLRTKNTVWLNNAEREMM